MAHRLVSSKVSEVGLGVLEGGGGLEPEVGLEVLGDLCEPLEWASDEELGGLLVPLISLRATVPGLYL